MCCASAMKGWNAPSSLLAESSLICRLLLLSQLFALCPPQVSFELLSRSSLTWSLFSLPFRGEEKIHGPSRPTWCFELYIAFCSLTYSIQHQDKLLESTGIETMEMGWQICSPTQQCEEERREEQRSEEARTGKDRGFDINSNKERVTELN